MRGWPYLSNEPFKLYLALVSLNPVYVMAIFEQTWEINGTKTMTFIGIITSKYIIFITTHAILATKFRIWATSAAWISSAWQNLTIFAPSVRKTITCWYAYATNYLKHTNSSVLAISFITEIDLTLAAAEWTNASATEFLGSSIVKANTFIL